MQKKVKINIIQSVGVNSGSVWNNDQRKKTGSAKLSTTFDHTKSMMMIEYIYKEKSNKVKERERAVEHKTSDGEPMNKLTPFSSFSRVHPSRVYVCTYIYILIDCLIGILDLHRSL